MSLIPDRFGSFVASLAIVSLSLAASAVGAEPLERRWVYLQTNLQVRENLDSAEALLRRAKKAGYNGVVLADYKLNVLDRVPEHYFEHAASFRKIADELSMEIVPTVAPIGYSDGLLAHDPNLAEGIPVRDAPFVVRGGVGVLDSDVTNALPGGGFEEARGDAAAGWSFQDGPGELSFLDEQVVHKGRGSLRWERPATSDEDRSKADRPNGRVSKIVKVSPWRQFHASVWIKTDGFDAAGQVRLFAIGAEGQTLSHSNLGVRATQDWTRHDVVFNSLGSDEIRLYCGTWGIGGGTLWMDDLVLEETAFVNLLRRDGCELTVVGEDGTRYEEGRDFAPLADPKLGRVPYAGSFEVWHEPPTLTIPAGPRIGEGAKLRISFAHALLVYDNQATCCLAHPKVFEILEDQVRRVQDLFDAKTLFLSHDEIRVANWCGSCRREGRSAGELLAENVRRCVAMIRKVDPDVAMCVWSDMFDPHHNAIDGYYLVNGDLAGSWEGLPREMGIVNWNRGAGTKSLAFFAERGHPQILSGFYDGDARSIGGWLREGEELSGIDGAMYTTWQDDFSGLEAFAEAAWGKGVPAHKR